jgi:malate dehydrogenase (oxaloacetate-decarboxylating)
MKDWKKRSLELHKNHIGKLEIKSKVPLSSVDDLSIAYTPGVAEPCLKIANNKDDVYKYTIKGNTVAIISDGSAVLGLGSIGPLAGLPVMEGKAIIFKEFANIDAFPIMLNTSDPDTIVETIKIISPTFGGINLEDISAPNCVYIERRLISELNIPVFHDDQHGTSIVVLAALINSCKLTNKNLQDLRIVISGVGAAGSNIAKILNKVGVKSIYAYNLNGVFHKDKYDDYNFVEKELIDKHIILSPNNIQNDSLKELLQDKDVFIGVSAPNIVSKSMVENMNKDPFVFALANPEPEISYNDAKSAGAKIVGTGRSDFPNQINNVLAFPGLFRGVLDAKITKITDDIKIAAAFAIASIIDPKELSENYIIPSPLDKRVVPTVRQAILDAFKKT